MSSLMVDRAALKSAARPAIVITGVIARGDMVNGNSSMASDDGGAPRRLRVLAS